jgi:glutathione S-transferase
MFEYKTVEEIKAHPGLRIVLVRGWPSPWGQAAKTIFEIKGLDYVAAPWNSFEENADIVEWSGENSAPIVAWADEKPISRWVDILFLAERLQPKPAMVPDDPMGRVLMMGFLQELCGQNGIAWNRRIQIVAPSYSADGERSGMTLIGSKYGYSADIASAAGGRIASSLRALSGQLKSQYERGSKFFIGNSLSALDIYWTAFAAFFDQLPREQCPMPDEMRPLFKVTDPAVAAALDPLLLEHRLRIFNEYFRSPIEM